MKSLANYKRISCAKSEENPIDVGKLKHQQARVHEVMDQNTQNQTYLKSIQQQMQKLTAQNSQLDLAINNRKKEFEELSKEMEEQQKEQGEEQHQMEMESWIQEVQKYTGVSQDLIDSLLSIEYEGSPDQEQICLSCYQGMEIGSKCKYLPCAHIFHAQCIDTHLKLNKTCPGCGEQVM